MYLNFEFESVTMKQEGVEYCEEKKEEKKKKKKPQDFRSKYLPKKGN